MNPRSIKKVLRGKFDDWVESIEDDEVKELVKDRSMITGGSIASLLLNEPVKDFDIYFRDKETVEAIAEYYVDKFNELNPDVSVSPHVHVEDDTGRVKIWVQSAGVTGEDEDGDYEYFEIQPNEQGDDYLDRVVPEVTDRTVAELEWRLHNYGDPPEEEKPRYRPVFLSPNAITLSDKVQLVIRFYGEPDEIHKNYDFAHATCHWTSVTGHLVTPKEALLSLLTRNIVYQGSLYPLCSMFRLRKFMKRGWYVDAGQMLKIGIQISELDLMKAEVLEEQLVGVDAAYFYQVLRAIKARQKEDENFQLTSTYLVSIIDRIWNYDVG